uniref:Uncharacterized protein n=1 Tax=Solanum tuberosum TaxID=4113 RepID=M1DNS0_SOLTU
MSLDEEELRRAEVPFDVTLTTSAKDNHVAESIGGDPYVCLWWLDEEDVKNEGETMGRSASHRTIGKVRLSSPIGPKKPHLRIV